MKTVSFWLVFGLFLPGIACAHSYRQGALLIGHAHTAPAQAGGRTEVYLPLLNTGAEPDRLIGVASAAAAAVTMDDGANATLPGIDLPPGQPVSLRPGGLHLTLSGLRGDVRVGAMVPLTLSFKQAGMARVEALVEPRPAAP